MFSAKRQGRYVVHNAVNTYVQLPGRFEGINAGKAMTNYVCGLVQVYEEIVVLVYLTRIVCYPSPTVDFQTTWVFVLLLHLHTSEK